MKKIIALTLFSSLLNLILFAEEKSIQWSDYQGKLSWKSADTKCVKQA